MPKLPILRARQLMKIAEKAGFIHETTHGSHYIYRRPKDGKTISIPYHQGKDLGRGITLAIIKDMDLTADKVRELL